MSIVVRDSFAIVTSHSRLRAPAGVAYCGQAYRPTLALNVVPPSARGNALDGRARYACACSRSGLPWLVATSTGTTIVTPIYESGRGVQARLIPERSGNHKCASAGVCSSEVALFRAQVPDQHRTRSLIVTKVAPFCHSALGSSPLRIKLRRRSRLLLRLE